ILPFNVYHLFHTKLSKAFSHIADVSFSFEARDTTFDEKLVQDYWSICIQEMDGISPPMLALLNEQKPTLQGVKVIVKT
ncbi:PolC-type DNA polymerase III N-terminal domain-containing protein, partial [Bacillus sp. GbtcB15]